VILPGLDWRQL